jgi:ribosomal protein S18 acetylase RimI-like enzyme
MKIYRNLPSEFLIDAGELFAAAFENKFSYFLGPKNTIQKIIPYLLNKEQIVSIVSDTEELIGIAGFSYKEKNMLSINIKAMVRQYGLIKGLYKILQLRIYFPNSFPLTYLYVDAITIKTGYRGKEYIRLLFEELEKVAFEKGITHLQLDVSYDNTSAVKAYEKIGFDEVKSENLSCSTARRIGISRVIRMIKILDRYLVKK